MNPSEPFWGERPILLAVEPIDMRMGIDGLSSRVQNVIGRPVCDGTAYAFTNRRRNRLKLLIWDGNGVWLAQRRLHKGSFAWPVDNKSIFSLSPGEWQWLISGVDWQRHAPPAPIHWRV